MVYTNGVRKKLAKLIQFIVGALFVFLLSAVFYNKFLFKLELVSLDLKQRSALVKADENIIFIDISDDSISQIGRWPWDRMWQAGLVNILKEYGARAVVFDILFSEKQNNQSDNLFNLAIEESKNVYLPIIINYENVFDKKLIVHDTTCNLPEFEKSAKGIGHIVAVPDSDGVTRRVPLFAFCGDKKYYAISYILTKDLMGEKFPQNIPLDENGNFILRWTGTWENSGFKHFSFVDVIKSYSQIQQSQKPIIDLNIFKNKICLVGITATGLGDIRTNSIQHSYPGVGYHANMLNSFMHGKYVIEIPGYIKQIIRIFFLLLIFYATLRLDTVRALVLFSFTVLGYGVFSFLVFGLFGYYFEFVYPIANMLWAYLMANIYKQYRLTAEKQRLFKIATTDGLTGLYTVRYFRELMENILNTKQQIEHYIGKGGICLIMCDVDKFKTFNDTYGHQVGDVVLKSFAKILKQNTRGLDIVARYGGEEFVIVLFNASLEDSFKIANKIRQAVEDNVINHEGKQYKMTASFGISLYDNNKDTLEDMVKRADDALYKAKESGRNRVC